jgi:hypothetical protein
MNKTIKNIIKTHVVQAVSRVDPTRYRQEAAYVNAVLGRLDGLVYKGACGEIEIKSTVVDDRGPGSAESKYGADFAVTVVLSSGKSTVEKAIIGQAKRGRIEELPANESERLLSQVDKMRKHTDQSVVLEVPELLGNSPRIRLPYVRNVGKFKPPVLLEDYITSQLIACLHGDRRKNFVDAVQDSTLSRLSLIIRI